MGITEGTLLGRATRERWMRQIESSKALANRKDAPLAITPVQAVAMSMQQSGERQVGPEVRPSLGASVKRRFCCKTAQLCVTRCDAEWPKHLASAMLCNAAKTRAKTLF